MKASNGTSQATIRVATPGAIGLVGVAAGTGPTAGCGCAVPGAGRARARAVPVFSLLLGFDRRRGRRFG